MPDRSRRPGLADDAIGGAGPQCPQPGELGNVPPCDWVRVLLPPVPAGAVDIEAVGHLLPNAGIIGAEAVGAQLGLTSGAFGIVWSAFGSLNFPNGKNVLHAAGMLSIQALTFGSIVKVGLSVGVPVAVPTPTIASPELLRRRCIVAVISERSDQVANRIRLGGGVLRAITIWTKALVDGQ